MSQTMLKRCLQLVEDDLPRSSSSKHTKKNPNKKRNNSTIFDMIPQQKRLTITTKAGKNQIKRKPHSTFFIHSCLIMFDYQPILS